MAAPERGTSLLALGKIFELMYNCEQMAGAGGSLGPGPS